MRSKTAASPAYCVIPFLLPPPKNPCPTRAEKASQAGRCRFDHDPEAVANAILRVLGQRDIVRHLHSKELGTELVNAFRGAIRLQELRSAVATLRQHLDADIAEEQVYQDSCEQRTWAFGNAYVMRAEAVLRDYRRGLVAILRGQCAQRGQAESVLPAAHVPGELGPDRLHLQ